MPNAPPNAEHLALLFLAASGAPGPQAQLGEELLALILAARATYPEVRLDDAIFVRHLARHLPAGAALRAWLGAIHAGDLYLACACAEGVPAAIEILDRRYRAEVGSFLHALRPAPDFVEDVAQTVSERLLVGAEGSPPRIAEYSGRGALGGWLRVVTLRVAVTLQRKRREVVSSGGGGEQGAQVDAAPADPEGELLKRRHAEAYNAAVLAAVGALTAEQRDLLRLHFVEGATFEQLVAKLGLSRATVARRIAAARQEVLARARRELGERLSLGPAEVESLMGLMRSRLDLSLSSAFPERRL